MTNASVLRPKRSLKADWDCEAVQWYAMGLEKSGMLIAWLSTVLFGVG